MTDQDMEDIQPKQRKKYKPRRASGEGSVRLKNSSWHLEYKDAEGSRKSAKLSDKDDLHFSATCAAVRELAGKKLKELTAASVRSNGSGPKPDLRVVDFWEHVYLRRRQILQPPTGNVVDGQNQSIGANECAGPTTSTVTA